MTACRSWLDVKVRRAQNPGTSKQDYATPVDFVDAVRKAFCVVAFGADLAAHTENYVATPFLGPGSGWGNDGLAYDWRQFAGDLWLNPPFADIEPWARKCAEAKRDGGRIFMLTPASVGSNWYAEHVHGKAHVVALSPRLCFDDKSPYPKDLILSIYGPVRGGFSTWRWK